MGLGYVYTEDIVIVYNEHVQNLGVCQTTASSSMKLAACLGQGSRCKALTHLFSRFHYGHPRTFVEWLLGAHISKQLQLSP